MVAVLKVIRVMKYSDGLALKLTLNVLLNIMYSLVRSSSLHGFMTSLQIAMLQLFNLQSCGFSTNKMPVSYSCWSQLIAWVNKIEHPSHIIWNNTVAYPNEAIHQRKVLCGNYKTTCWHSTAIQLESVKHFQRLTSSNQYKCKLSVN